MVWPTVCRACNNQNGISLLSCPPIPQKSAGCPACPPLWRRPRLLTCSCCTRSSRSVFAHLFHCFSLSLTVHLAIQHATVFSETHPSLYNTYTPRSFDHTFL